MIMNNFHTGVHIMSFRNYRLYTEEMSMESYLWVPSVLQGSLHMPVYTLPEYLFTILLLQNAHTLPSLLIP